MSVSSQLDDARSPLSVFMAKRFPNTRPFLVGLNRLLAKSPLLEPNGAVPSYDYGVIGTALDYRIRLYFDESATTKGYLVAERGAEKAQEFVARAVGGKADAVRATCDAFFEEVRNTIAAVKPVGRRLEPSEEDHLGRCCLALALFDSCFRATVRMEFPVIGPLLRYDPAGILALARQEWLDDLRQLSWQFAETQAALLGRRPVHLNPVFDGSHDVGGADADLIVEGDIIDITSTRRPPLTREKLYEVLTYVLLDYADAYSIRGLGLYVARRGTLARWDLDECLTALAQRPVSLTSERRGLRKALTS